MLQNKGATALHYAASSNNVEAFKRLLLCNASIDAQDCEGNTPLHYAAMTDALDVAKHAVAHGASVEVRDKQGASPAHAAVAGWNPPSPNADCEEHLVGLLDCWTVESSSEPVLNSSSVVRERMAALHTARFKKKGTSMLDFLVSSGADVNCTTDQGLTPLHHAALGGNVQHVQALLAHGADVNAQATIELVNRDSITYPDLHEPEYIPSWLSYHVEFVALYGWTPLQAAITKGVQTRQMRINTDDGQVQSDTEDGNLFQVVSLLVDAGASLSARP